MHKIPEDIKSIDDRVSKLVERKNISSKDDKHTDFSNIALGLQIAIELVSGTIVGMGIGYLLDKIFAFNFIFLVLFTILGGVAGIINVVRYVKQVNANKDKE